MSRNVFYGSASWFLVLVAAFIGDSLHATTIDDFSQGAVTLIDALGAGSASNLTTGLQPSHTFARARHITFNAIDPHAFGDSGIVTVAVDANDGGSLKLLPEPGLTAANLFVSYGVASLGLPPMSLNLRDGGADRIVFDFAFTVPDARISSARFALDVLMKSGNGTSFYIFQSVPSSATPFSLQLPFSEILARQPTFDLANVTEMRIGTGNGTMQGEFEMSAIRTNSLSEVLAGDFNADGTVDAADYVVWRKNPGGIYTQDDFNTWRANFGATLGVGSGAAGSASANGTVPEPATLLMLTVTAAGLSTRRRRRT